VARAQLLVDGTDTNTALLVQGASGQITRAFVQQLPGDARAPAVQTATRLWFNPGREPRKFYGPGMLVLSLSIFPTVLAALAMSREGEQQTILQVYVSSISAHEYLLGKILAGMVIGTVPIENIPRSLAWISSLVQARYYIVLVRDAFLQGGGWPAVWWAVLMIGVLGAGYYALAWLAMRRMQVKA
jgi:ABC-type multidrug transport system permease subunit